MTSLEERKAQRFRFLHGLYNATDGDSASLEDIKVLSEQLGMEKAVADRTMEYLMGEGLAEWKAMSLIAITHYGVVQVERALEHPEEPTEYFPPVVNIVNVTNMVGSQIQQAGHGANQKATLTENDLEAVLRFIKEVEDATQELVLDDELLQDLTADIATVKAQAGSRRPKTAIVVEALRSIRAILENAGGAVVASQLLSALPTLIGRLGA